MQRGTFGGKACMTWTCVSPNSPYLVRQWENIDRHIIARFLINTVIQYNKFNSQSFFSYNIKEIIDELTEKMLHYASEMEFEKAAEIRDKIKALEENY